ncbi:Glu/Leu/Phe/Val dehydrogenase [Amycolatopsis rhizosphaerae]|uniref:Glu/Leu/Phe/Val dehydrogenase n=1 Tax=Amycolatopsis rhizosphaerae TaxID=2053003 RepID=A0A558DJT6_9PSEU|nr:Glu/Leu/Phe/Val dehydrogenase dimerization domain-containing protein [Amycolatopsis rhizosphaerae]TVT61273.1 Glu/Leu/Phe/Val dehydrogenase [Amycolatopsis rhizosphaerae]
MTVDELAAEGFEQVLLCHDEETGLRSVVAVHDTTLGAALGGVRMRPYPTEDAAIAECKSLAKAMTLKAAATGLDLGGGWSVILGDPREDKTDALLRAHGRAIATLGGRFIPVNDVGTTQPDIAVIGEETSPVCAQDDPSPMTALGVLEGIRACVRHRLGRTDLGGLRVNVQGAGHVGAALVRLLVTEGADVTVADVLPDRTEHLAAETGARVVDPADLPALDCDVFAPCALGGIVTDATIPTLRCQVIAGGANNVLGAPEHAPALANRDILYAPDFCVNAGGLIFLAEQLLGHDFEQARNRVLGVGDVIREVLARADRENISTTQAAHDLAMARLKS